MYQTSKDKSKQIKIEEIRILRSNKEKVDSVILSESFQV